MQHIFLFRKYIYACFDNSMNAKTIMKNIGVKEYFYALLLVPYLIIQYTLQKNGDQKNKKRNKHSHIYAQIGFVLVFHVQLFSTIGT